MLGLDGSDVLGVADEVAWAEYPVDGASEAEGTETPGSRNAEAATRVAPTHRTRVMPRPARREARRADRLMRLKMAPGISLTVSIVRATRQSGESTQG